MLAHRTTRRRAALAALSLMLIAVGCEDNVVGPPDALDCTRGSLAVGPAKAGKVDASSCLLWNDLEQVIAPGESWSFETAANTAYIVRMRPTADANGVNNLVAELYLYARTDAGEPYFATGTFNSFGDLNTNDGRGAEMVFSSRRSETVSIRVQTREAADTGSYSLEVIGCPVAMVARGAPSAPVTLDDNCVLLTSPGLPGHAAFFTFDATANERLDVTATRTAGDAVMQLMYGGPGFDFACYGSECTFRTTATGAGPLTAQSTFDETGYFTAMVLQKSAGTLTATVGVAPPAPPLTAAAR